MVEIPKDRAAYIAAEVKRPKVTQLTPTRHNKLGAGRPKGTKNKSYEEARQRAAKLGETPLEYMLRIMNSPGVKTYRRDDMAKAAAPFMHNRLATMEHKGDPKNPIKTVSRIVIVAATAEDAAKKTAQKGG